MLEKPESVDFSAVKKMKKAEIIQLFKDREDAWMKYDHDRDHEFNQRNRALDEDIHNHEDYQAMKKALERAKLEKAEAERQKMAKQKELDEKKKWKKAGRPALDPVIVDRIKALRGQGLSIRKIAAALQDEGYTVHPATVGNYVKNRQTEN